MKLMLPTASFSTGNKDVPTGSILIAFSWLEDSSSVLSEGGGLAVALAGSAVFRAEGWTDSDLRRTAAIANAKTATNGITVFLFSGNRRFSMHSSEHFRPQVGNTLYALSGTSRREPSTHAATLE